MQVANIRLNNYGFDYKKTGNKPARPVSVADNSVPYQNVTSPAVSFLGVSQKYLNAKQYIERVKQIYEFLPPKNTDIYEFSLNNLDGIQEGIKVFNGLNMKEIAFLTRTMTEFGVNRGCHNMCSYCYADAKPPIKETAETINKMSWNDFKSLTDGLNELNDRLGFYVSGPNVSGKRNYISPFHDADGIEVALKDNNGVEHDFIDIADELYRAVGVPVVFDTAGWTPSNKKLQERAERIAAHYSLSENEQILTQFNISFHPFHALHTRQVLLERTGDIERANKFKDLYENRMANAIYTFTPMLESRKMGFIQRVATSNEPVFDGFREADLQKMHKSIMKKVRVLYEKDLEGEQKFSKTSADVEGHLSQIKMLMTGHVASGITLAERGQELFGKANRHALETGDRAFSYNQRMADAKNVKDIFYNGMNGIVDANGDYYLTSWSATFPTEIKLNFENKGKLTAPIRPYLQEDTPITRTVINTVK